MCCEQQFSARHRRRFLAQARQDCASRGIDIGSVADLVELRAELRSKGELSGRCAERLTTEWTEDYYEIIRRAA